MDNIPKKFIRSPLIEKLPKNIHFQAISWYTSDFEIIYDNTSDETEKFEYILYICGVTSEGNSVTTRVNDFQSYFYVQIPLNFSTNDIDRLFKSIKNKLYKDSYGLVGYSKVDKKKILPFLANKKFKFIRLKFRTDKSFKKCKYMFSDINQERYPIKVAGIPNRKYEAFETNIEHIIRFCHSQKIETTGWINVKNFTEELEYSTTQINISVSCKDICGDKETKSIAPLSIFSWDIECLPENTEEFPNPDLPNDIICQIGIVLNIYGNNKVQKIILTNKPCSPIKDALVIVAENEKKLLENFCELYKRIDPDIFTGYNTWGFDDKYTWKRMNRHDVDTSCFSRISQVQTILAKKELSSSAYGNNEYNYIMCAGRETFDLIEAIRREHKLESYSLKSVAEHFLKEYKVDMPYRELFKKLASNNPDDIAECAVYCIQDSNLVLRLILKLNMIPNYIEMAKATYVPQEWLLFRGQQCKVFSLIVKAAMENGYIIPEHKKTQAYAFKGATVLSAYTGLYYDPIAGLDFASLYPSIMIAYNMCYSTFIADEEMMKYVIENNIPYKTIEWEEDVLDREDEINDDTAIGRTISGYCRKHEDFFRSLASSFCSGNCENEELEKCHNDFANIGVDSSEFDIKKLENCKEQKYECCDIYNSWKECEKCKHLSKLLQEDEKIRNKNTKKKFSFSFVQCEDDKGNPLENGVRGLLGEILLGLWQGRKATKKLMKTEKDPFMQAVLNGKQLAQKVTMNSIYGFTGADNGIFPLKPIAACVTATGRKMIEQTSSIAKEEFGAITIYGDSIPGYEIITTVIGETIQETSIEEFANKVSEEWQPYRGFKLDDINIDNKMYKDMEGSGYLTYTHEGYKPIKKIIKHDTLKKLYKIKTRDRNGNIHSVVVTEGHSLIDSNGELLTAESARVGDKLFEY
jgi:DNA polymerase elongation subunit (family B)